MSRSWVAITLCLGWKALAADGGVLDAPTDAGTAAPALRYGSWRSVATPAAELHGEFAGTFVYTEPTENRGEGAYALDLPRGGGLVQLLRTLGAVDGVGCAQLRPVRCVARETPPGSANQLLWWLDPLRPERRTLDGAWGTTFEFAPAPLSPDGRWMAVRGQRDRRGAVAGQDPTRYEVAQFFDRKSGRARVFDLKGRSAVVVAWTANGTAVLDSFDPTCAPGPFGGCEQRLDAGERYQYLQVDPTTAKEVTKPLAHDAGDVVSPTGRWFAGRRQLRVVVVDLTTGEERVAARLEEDPDLAKPIARWLSPTLLAIEDQRCPIDAETLEARCFTDEGDNPFLPELVSSDGAYVVRSTVHGYELGKLQPKQRSTP